MGISAGRDGDMSHGFMDKKHLLHHPKPYLCYFGHNYITIGVGASLLEDSSMMYLLAKVATINTR